MSNNTNKGELARFIEKVDLKIVMVGTSAAEEREVLTLSGAQLLAKAVQQELAELKARLDKLEGLHKVVSPRAHTYQDGEE